MKFIMLSCLNCKSDYSRYISEIKKGSSFCTRKCANDYRTITTNCLKCNQEFQAYRSDIERGGGKFCSRKCYSSDEIFINCLHCDKLIKVHDSSRKRGGGKFCSKSCSGKYNFKPISFYDSSQERFYKNISTENNNFECWVWVGLKNKAGYGRMRINNKDKVAHRYSWEIHYGEIPKSMIICHKCDNPSCVNPDHLFIGTHKDNAIDMVRKGRNRDDRGENHPSAKLNNEKVLQIRQRLKNGESAFSLAKEFFVQPMTISNIKLNKSWLNI